VVIDIFRLKDSLLVEIELEALHAVRPRVHPFQIKSIQGVSLSGLLDLAVKAHGGLDRWNKVKAIKVAAITAGSGRNAVGRHSCGLLRW
jgi:hypothetical protein